MIHQRWNNLEDKLGCLLRPKAKRLWWWRWSTLQTVIPATFGQAHLYCDSIISSQQSVNNRQMYVGLTRSLLCWEENQSSENTSLFLSLTQKMTSLGGCIELLFYDAGNTRQKSLDKAAAASCEPAFRLLFVLSYFLFLFSSHVPWE